MSRRSRASRSSRSVISFWLRITWPVAPTCARTRLGLEPQLTLPCSNPMCTRPHQAKAVSSPEGCTACAVHRGPRRVPAAPPWASARHESATRWRPTNGPERRRGQRSDPLQPLHARWLASCARCMRLSLAPDSRHARPSSPRQRCLEQRPRHGRAPACPAPAPRRRAPRRPPATCAAWTAPRRPTRPPPPWPPRRPRRRPPRPRRPPPPSPRPPRPPRPRRPWSWRRPPRAPARCGTGIGGCLGAALANAHKACFRDAGGLRRCLLLCCSRRLRPPSAPGGACMQGPRGPPRPWQTQQQAGPAAPAACPPGAPVACRALDRRLTSSARRS